MVDLMSWLIEEVGLPNGDDARKGLYAKLIRLQAKYGFSVEVIIAETWLRAREVASKKPVSHWFAKMVKVRLVERHMWHEPSALEGKTSEEIHRMAFADHKAPLFDGPGRREPSPDVAKARQAMIDRIGKEF